MVSLRAGVIIYLAAEIGLADIVGRFNGRTMLELTKTKTKHQLGDFFFHLASSPLAPFFYSPTLATKEGTYFLFHWWHLFLSSRDDGKNFSVDPIPIFRRFSPAGVRAPKLIKCGPRRICIKHFFFSMICAVAKHCDAVLLSAPAWAKGPSWIFIMRPTGFRGGNV